jgi:lycopene cyclase domain-containing protein
MAHLTYLAVLLACLIGTLPLEFAFRARVYRRFRRAATAILPVAALFLAWDFLAAAAGWWFFDPAYLVGVWVGGLPLEELLFFLVIPICGILTLEGVRHFKPRWAEPAARERFSTERQARR